MKQLSIRPVVVALAAIVHLLPLPFGVSPVGALAIYGGACGPRHGFWAIPLVPLFLGNLIFGFYQPLVLAFVYLGFSLSAVCGRLMLKRHQSHPRMGLAAVIGAVVFYLVSNFSIWLAGMYPMTTAGLINCYLNGLPFLGQAVIMDGLFVFALFGLHRKLAVRQMPRADAMPA